MTDFRKRVENPPVAGARILGVPRWFFVVALGAALGLLAWWAATI
ncbi:MAG: hypothetical protein R3208_11140 [Ketobacteraceae bacterium]|nr:hypothetical protein [Ketobacteraceae bacterium]